MVAEVLIRVDGNLAGTRRSIEHGGVIIVVGNRQANCVAHNQQGIDPYCGLRLRGFVISGRERDSATDQAVVTISVKMSFFMLPLRFDRPRIAGLD